MSLDSFPEHIDPQKLFARNGAVSGVIPLKSLQRFTEYLYASNDEQKPSQAVSQNGDVVVELFFSRDEGSRRVMTGNLETSVSLCCQRCLGEVSVHLQVGINILVVNDEAKAESFGREVDWVLAPLGEFDVRGLLEDELILSLPIVAYHEDKDCNCKLVALLESAKSKVESADTSPFAGLSGLKAALQEEGK